MDDGREGPGKHIPRHLHPTQRRFPQAKKEVETIPGTSDRIEDIVGNTWYSTSDPTNTHQDQFQLAMEALA
jgi:hypothetical protein